MVNWNQFRVVGRSWYRGSNRSQTLILHKLFLISILLWTSAVLPFIQCTILSHFDQLKGAQLTNVFSTFTSVSKLICANECIEFGLTSTCLGANYNLQSRECQLSDDVTQTVTSTSNTYTWAMLLPVPVLSCADILAYGIGSTSGVYEVTINGSPVQVYCDMDTLGGGWTVFQYRYDGSVAFNRDFNDYENGFGNYAGEFWLGLENISAMSTGTTSEIYIEFTSHTDTTVYEILDNFEVGPSPSYVLSVGEVTSSTDGTPNSYQSGGSLYYNTGYSFSTYDADSSNSCATKRHSGFWFRSCTWINPNGEYVTPGTQSAITNGWGGIIHYTLSQFTSYKGTKMMFRRH